MNKLLFKIILVIGAIGLVIILAFSNPSETIKQKWWFDKNAVVSPSEIISSISGGSGGFGSYSVYRIIDYQTGKVIYLTRNGICVTNLEQQK